MCSSETSPFDNNKIEIIQFPDEPSNLILSFMFARNPPLPPISLGWDLKLASIVGQPGQGANCGDTGIEISWINPLNK